jgi:hypothetical protein
MNFSLFATRAIRPDRWRGVPYDGGQTIVGGKGKWWEGMDPQMLNGKPHAKNTPCPEFVQQFLLRVQEVIDSYSPDILNFDEEPSSCSMRVASGLPKGMAGHSRSRAAVFKKKALVQRVSVLPT